MTRRPIGFAREPCGNRTFISAWNECTGPTLRIAGKTKSSFAPRKKRTFAERKATKHRSYSSRDPNRDVSGSLLKMGTGSEPHKLDPDEYAFL